MHRSSICWQHGPLLLALLPLAILPWLWAGAHPSTWLLVSISFIAALFWQSLTQSQTSAWWKHPLGWLLGVMIFCGILQLLPLPLPLLRIISPHSALLYTDLASQPQHWSPITLDMPHQWTQLLYLCMILLAALSYMQCCNHPKAQTFLCTVITLSALANSAFSTFINPNHLAAYLGLAAWLAISLSLNPTGNKKWLWAVIAVWLASALIPTQSYSAALAFVISLILFGGRFLTWHRLKTANWAFTCSISATLILVGAFLWLNRHLPWHKIHVWQGAFKLANDFPFFGIGLGAFGSTFAKYQPAPIELTYTHVENWPLDLLSAYGWPASIFILLCLLRLGQQLWHRTHKQPHQWAIYCGMFFLSIQNLADFSWAVAAISVSTIMLLVSLGAPPKQTSTIKYRYSLTIPIIVMGLSLWPSFRYSIEKDTERLRTTPKNAQNILLRHPSHFTLPLLVAAHDLRHESNPQKAIRWINHAMQCAPQASLPHQLAASALWMLGHAEQAQLELKLACQYAPTCHTQQAQHLLAFKVRQATLIKVAKTAPDVALEVIKQWRQQHQFMAALHLANHTLTRAPGSTHIERAKIYMAQQRWAKALDSIHQAIVLGHNTYQNQTLKAEAATQNKNWTMAMYALKNAQSLSQTPEQREKNLLSQARLLQQQRLPTQVIALSQILQHSLSISIKAHALSLAAWGHDRLHHTHQALSHSFKATTLLPKDPTILQQWHYLEQKQRHLAAKRRD